MGCRIFLAKIFEGKKLTKLWALDELFELPLLIYHIVIIHNGKFIHNLIEHKKISTTMGSNTGFLGENPIRKGKIPTSYGFFLCTQFSPLLKFFKEISKGLISFVVIFSCIIFGLGKNCYYFQEIINRKI